MYLPLEKVSYFAYIFFFTFCIACSNKSLDRVQSDLQANPVRNSTLDFAGVSSVSSITTTTATLNWTPSNQVVNYFIFQSTPTEAETIVATAAKTASQYIVTGLTANKTYTFKVKASDFDGILDVNTVSKEVTTLKEGSFAELENMSTTVGAAISQNLDCHDEYNSTPTYSVESESDAHAGCSISGGSVTCTPTSGNAAPWSAVISVQCILNESTLVETFELTVQ